MLVLKFQNSKEIKNSNEIKGSKNNELILDTVDMCTRINEEKSILESATTLKLDQEYLKHSKKPEKTESSEINDDRAEDYRKTQKLKESMENILINYNNLLTKIEKLTKKEKFRKMEEMVKLYFIF